MDTKNFTYREFSCNCGCGVAAVSNDLLAALEKLRSAIGDRPIRIISGYRCPEHNKKVGGAKNSQHMHGTAADIMAPGVPIPALWRMAKSIPEFTGLGRGATFVHVDVRPGARVSWSYPPNNFPTTKGIIFRPQKGKV